jgi:hypothetical protein
LSQCLRRLFSVTSNVGDVFKTVFPRERLILPGAGIGVAKNTAEFLYFLKSGGVDFQKYRSRWFLYAVRVFSVKNHSFSGCFENPSLDKDSDVRSTGKNPGG